MSDVRSDKPNVCSVNRSIGPHVFAKVAAGYSHADLISRLCDVRILYGFVAGGIADEHVLRETAK
jgi:hypothetical protein